MIGNKLRHLFIGSIRFFCLLLIMGLTNDISAQVKFNTAINRQIDANYSGHKSDVEITFDGGYVAVSGGSGLNITKFSAVGTVQWSKDVSWGGGIYYARHLVQLKDSGYAVTGTGGPGYDPDDSWQIAFMRLDKNGNLLWVKTINNAFTQYNFNMGSWIAQTLDGGLIIAGQTEAKGILIKTDINGTLQWANTYPQVSRFNTGFLNSDTSYTLWGIYDNSNFYVGKVEIDKNGNVLNGKSYRNSFFTHYLSVKRTRDKGYIALIDYYGTSPILFKTDSVDNVMWSKQYTFSNNSNGTRDCRDVTETHDGYVFVGETFAPPNAGGYSSAFWAKTDNSGTIMWQRVYNTSYWDVAYSVKQTADKGLILWTSMFTTGSSIVSDLIKTDSLGNTVCTLYSEPVTSASLNLSPTALTFTSSPVSGIIDRTNSYSGPGVTTYYPCPVVLAAGFSANRQSICEGDSIAFSDLSTGGPNSWAWSFPGGSPSVSTAQNPIVTYVSPGTYNVKLAIRNSGGADSIVRTSYIEVSALPLSGTVSGPDSVCEGATVQLVDNGHAGAIQWQSSVDGLNYSNVSGAIDSLYSVSNITVSGYYRVVASNSCGGDTSNTLHLIVSLIPVPVVTSSDTLICSSDSARIDVASTYSSYLWNTGDTLSYIYVENAGGYWVTVSDAIGCSAVSEHQNISVHPVTPISIIVQGDTLSSFNATSYQWYRNDTLIPAATQAVYVAHQTGYYSLEIIDNNGCVVRSSQVYVSVNALQELVESNLLDIFPNPTNDFVIVRINSDNSVGQLRLYDALGKLIRVIDAKPIQTIWMEGLVSGIYYFVFQSNNPSTLTAYEKLSKF